jgi:hypothetical protein
MCIDHQTELDVLRDIIAQVNLYSADLRCASANGSCGARIRAGFSSDSTRNDRNKAFSFPAGAVPILGNPAGIQVWGRQPAAVGRCHGQFGGRCP